MHVLLLNLGCDPAIETPRELVSRYSTLTGWADALSDAGARVTVVQRFHHDAEISRCGVRFRYVRDRMGRQGTPLDWPLRTICAASEYRPDAVHVNGMRFAPAAALLARRVPGAGTLVQDHGGLPPRSRASRALLHAATARVGAVSFTAADQPQLWRDSGCLHHSTRVVELMEASTDFEPVNQQTARQEIALEGAPLCLWVGRLDRNKDPLTVLHGFELAACTLRSAQLVMVYHTDELYPEVRAFLADRPHLAQRVQLLGKRQHEEMPLLLSAADFYVSASHREGSGYALLEAMACGAYPVVSDIPPFRAITGGGQAGKLWRTGNAEAFADALIAAAGATPSRPAVRRWFDEKLSWPAVAQRAMQVYAELLRRAS